MKPFYVAVILAALVTSASAEPPLVTVAPISAREILRDFEVVMRAPYFVVGSSAYDEEATRLQAAFRRLQQSPAAATQCRKLVAGATPAGQIYGLLGLKRLNDPAFALLARRYKASRDYMALYTETLPPQIKIAVIAGWIDDGSLK